MYPLLNVYSCKRHKILRLPNAVEVMRAVGVPCVVQKPWVCHVWCRKCLVKNAEGKGLRGRPSRRREYNLILKKEGMNWNNVAEDRDRLWALVKTALDLFLTFV